jgi:hypothetical protein
LISSYLINGESIDLNMGNTPRKRLGALSQQLGRSASQHQELRPPPIGQDAQGWKQFWPTLDFVDHHQAPEAAQNEVGFSKSGEIRLMLQIEESRDLALLGDQPGQGALADLPRTQDRDNGKLLEARFDKRLQSGPLDHGAQHTPLFQTMPSKKRYANGARKAIVGDTLGGPN